MWIYLYAYVFVFIRAGTDLEEIERLISKFQLWLID